MHTQAEPLDQDPRRWIVLAVLCTALCAIVIDNTILSIAVPSIGRDLGGDETDLQWITAAYALSLSGLLLPLAVLGDRFGRKRLFLMGIAVFGAASGLAAMATTTPALVVCRAIMGVGGAAAMPATLAIVGNVFNERERGRALAVWSGVAGFAAAAGPLVGGVLLAHYWWGSVFLVNVPLTVAAVVAAALFVPESRDPAAPGSDWPGTALWTAALVALLFGIIEGPERGWATAMVFVPLAAAAMLLAAFVVREQRAEAPLLAPATARHPGMRAGAAIIPAVFFALFGTQFVMTQWLQGPRALGTIAAASCFVPNALCSILGSFSNPRMVRRFTTSGTVRIGSSVVVGGLIVAGTSIAVESVAFLVVGFGVVGLGQGWVIPCGIELIMTSAPPQQAGSVAGINETIVEAGGALGVAVMGSVLVGMSSFSRPLVAAIAVVGFGTVVSLRVLARAAPEAQADPPT